MNADILYEAIGEIGDEYILDAERKPRPDYRRIFRTWVAACAAVVVLALPVSAEVMNGYVSNLLAPLYGGARTELVDRIGVPIGASVTVGDYTLTADAVIGDRYNIAVVYTLKRNDDGIIPEGLHFAAYTDNIRTGSGGGFRSHERSEDGRSLRIVTQWTSTGRLLCFNRNAQVTFRDLMRKDADGGEDILIEEGSWTLAFTVRYEDTTVKLPVNDLAVTDIGGKQFRIRKILLSPIGIHMDMQTPNPHTYNASDYTFRDFTVSVLLTDGSVIKLEDRNIGARGKEGKAMMDADYGAMFDEPIPVDEITAVIICGTVIPVK